MFSHNFKLSNAEYCCKCIFSVSQLWNCSQIVELWHNYCSQIACRIGNGCTHSRGLSCVGGLHVPCQWSVPQEGATLFVGNLISLQWVLDITVALSILCWIWTTDGWVSFLWSDDNVDSEAFISSATQLCLGADMYTCENVKGLAPAEHRIRMCELAVADSPFIMVDSWEVSSAAQFTVGSMWVPSSFFALLYVLESEA